MGKARSAAAAAAAATSTTNTTSRSTGSGKQMPNVASAGFAFLVAGGYTPLPLSTPPFPSSSVGAVTSASAPLHEFATAWPTRSEACQAIRDSGLVKSKVGYNRSAAQHNAHTTLGKAPIDVEALKKMRDWIRQVTASSENVDSHTMEVVRSLVRGLPVSAAASADGFDPVLLDGGGDGAVPEGVPPPLLSSASDDAAKTVEIVKKEEEEQPEQQPKEEAVVAEDSAAAQSEQPEREQEEVKPEVKIEADEAEQQKPPLAPPANSSSSSRPPSTSLPPPASSPVPTRRAGAGGAGGGGRRETPSRTPKPVKVPPPVDLNTTDLETCSWETLASITRWQIDTVLDPFLKARGWM